MTVEDLTSLNLARTTAAERIADGICELILRGEVEPGTPLKEGELQQAIGVSRNTIREALRLLARDRLVVYHPYRGVSVAELTRHDVVDLFRARSILELRAVEEIGSITDGQLAKLILARKERERHVAAQDWHAAFEADMRFHAALVALLGSEALNEAFVSLLRRLRLGFYVRGGLSTEGRARDTKQHRRIEELVRSGEVKKCRNAVEEHLGDAEQLLLDLISEPVVAGSSN